MTDDIDTIGEYVIAPQHGPDLAELDPHVIEGVAYSPLKTKFCMNYDEDTRVYCKSCEWETTIGDLPEDIGRVQPDMCPDCAKRQELGFVRKDPPEDAKAATMAQ